MHTLEGVIFLRHIRSLLVEVMVGPRPTIIAEDGYGYGTRHARGYGIFSRHIRDRTRGDKGGRVSLLTKDMQKKWDWTLTKRPRANPWRNWHERRTLTYL